MPPAINTSAQEAAHLRAQANHQQTRSDDLSRSAKETHGDEQLRLDHQADEAKHQAASLNARASALVAEYTPDLADSEAELAEKNPERRAWKLPGSIAEGDVMLQAQEADEGPGLLAEAAMYALRSAAVDRDGKAWNATKDALTNAFGNAEEPSALEQVTAAGAEIASNADHTAAEIGESGSEHDHQAATDAKNAPEALSDHAALSNDPNARAAQLVRQNAPQTGRDEPTLQRQAPARKDPGQER